MDSVDTKHNTKLPGMQSFSYRKDLYTEGTSTFLFAHRLILMRTFKMIHLNMICNMTKYFTPDLNIFAKPTKCAERFCYVYFHEPQTMVYFQNGLDASVKWGLYIGSQSICVSQTHFAQNFCYVKTI